MFVVVIVVRGLELAGQLFVSEEGLFEDVEGSLDERERERLG